MLNHFLRVLFAPLGAALKCIRLLSVLVAAVLMLSCGGGGGGATPPPSASTPEILALVVSPVTAKLAIKTNAQFTVAVQSQGSIDTSVNWYVNDVLHGNSQVGTITDSGAYTAPNSVPSATVSIKAVAKADNTKSSSATVTVLPTLSVSPVQPNILYGETRQFTATLDGSTDNRFQWSASRGTISADGLYSAPASGITGSTEKVSAAWISDPSVTASTLIQLKVPPPQITSITPASASVGEKITIHGQGFQNVNAVYFSCVGSIELRVTDFTQTSTEDLTVTVPNGVRSGPVILDTQFGGTSNLFTFTRKPSLRIRADKNEISANETVQMQWRAIGPGSVPSIEWSADAGNIDASGLFTAPAVTTESFVRVKACFTGSTVCESLLFRVTPLRISPTHPTVTAGSMTPLDALRGENSVSVDWSVPSGLGTVTGAGEYTAASMSSDAGAVTVTAKYGAELASDVIGVSGKFPGIVHRVQDFVNERESTLDNWLTRAVTVSGNRAFVAGGTEGGSGALYFDVFDVTDPTRPVWIDSVESLFGDEKMYRWGSLLFQPEFQGSSLAVYDISQGRPELVRALSLPPFWYVYNPNLAFHNGKFYAYAGNQWTIDRTYDDILVMDVSNGGLNVSTIRIDLPASLGLVPPLARYSIGVSDNRLGVMYTNGPGSTNTVLPLVFDTTTTPPTYMGQVRAFDTFTFDDSLLITDTGLYDVSGNQPVELARTRIHHVLDQKGKLFAARDFAGDLNVVDLTDPRNPNTLLKIWDVSGEYGAFAGNSVLTTGFSGGLASTDVRQGGPKYITGGTFRAGVFDMVVEGPYVYTAGFGTQDTVQVFNSSATLSVISSYSENPGTENAIAYSIRKAGNYLFVGYRDHISIIDAHNPANLSRVAKLDIPTSFLAIQGSILVAGTFDKRLVTIDVQNPAAPVVLGQAPLPSEPYTVRTWGNVAFVADAESGLLMFDISAPATPVLVGHYDVTATDVAIEGGRAFVSAWYAGVVILDVSNPAAPQLLSKIELPSCYPWHIIQGRPSMEPYRGFSLALNNGILWVEAIDPSDEFSYPTFIYGYDYRQISAPRLVTSYNHNRERIYAFGFGGSQMFTAGGEDLFVQYDISEPRNSIMAGYTYPALLWWTQPVQPQRSRTQASTEKLPGRYERHSQEAPPASGQPLTSICESRFSCRQAFLKGASGSTDYSLK